MNLTAFLIVALAIVVNERVVSAQNDNNADLLVVETKSNALTVIEGPKAASLPSPNAPKINQTFLPQQRPPSKPPINPTPDKNYFLPQFFSPLKKLQVPIKHVFTNEPLKISNSVYKYPNAFPVQHLNLFNHPTNNINQQTSVNYPSNFNQATNNFNYPPKNFIFPPNNLNNLTNNLNYPPKIFNHPTNNFNNITNNFNPPKSNFYQAVQQPRPPYIYSAVTGKPGIINSPKFSLPVQTINGIGTEFVRPPKISNLTVSTTAVPTTTTRLLRTKRIWPAKILRKMNTTSENRSLSEDILKNSTKISTDLVTSGSRISTRYVKTEKPTTSTTESTTRFYRRVTRTPKINSTTTLKPILQNDWIPIVPSHYPKRKPIRTRTKRQAGTYNNNQAGIPGQKNMFFLQSYSLIPMPGAFQSPATGNNMVFFRKKNRHLNPDMYEAENDVKPMNPYAYAPTNNPKSILNPHAYASNNNPRSVLSPFAYDHNLKAVFNPQAYLSDYTTKPINPYEFEADHTPNPLDPYEYSSDYSPKPVLSRHAYGSNRHSKAVNPFAIHTPKPTVNPYLYPLVRHPKSINPLSQVSDLDVNSANDLSHSKVVTKIKHHHHHHHHKYVKTVEKPVNVPVKVEVPKPYPVEKQVPVPVPVEKIKFVDRPYPVPVEKKVPYPVPVPQPVPVKVVEKEYVPKPYPVFQQVPVLKQVEVKVPQPVPVQVETKVPVPVRVEVPVEKPVPVQVTVEKRVPYPVPVKVLVPQPYTVEKKVPYPVEVKVKEPYEVIKHVPIKIPIPQLYPVRIPHPVRVEVEKKVPYPVKIEKKIPVPIEVVVPKHIEVERKIPVYIPKPYPVEKKIPYPVKIPIKVPFPVKIPVKVPIEVPVQVPIYIHHPFQIINDDNIINSNQGYPPGDIYGDNQIFGASITTNQVSQSPHSTSRGESGHNHIEQRSDTENTTTSTHSS